MQLIASYIVLWTKDMGRVTALVEMTSDAGSAPERQVQERKDYVRVESSAAESAAACHAKSSSRRT